MGCIPSSSISRRMAMNTWAMEAAQIRQRILGRKLTPKHYRSRFEISLARRLRRRHAMYKDDKTGILYVGGKSVPRQRFSVGPSGELELINNKFTILVSMASESFSSA